MNGSRRRLLAATGGVVAALSGCLSSVPGGFEDDAPGSPDDGSGGTTAKTTGYPDTVAVTTTVDREGVEYVESNDTVRYVAAWRTDHSGETPTRDPVYEHVSFDEWAGVECASVAAKRVGEVMNRRLGGTDEGIGVGVTVEDGERTVVVEHQTVLDREGDVVSKPTVSDERMKRVAPERVSVAFSFAARTRECSVAVITREVTIRQQ